MSYDADRDAQKIQEEVHQLQINYEQAQEDIIDKIRKNKRDFDQRVCTLICKISILYLVCVLRCF